MTPPAVITLTSTNVPDEGSVVAWITRLKSEDPRRGKNTTLAPPAAITLTSTTTNASDDESARTWITRLKSKASRKKKTVDVGDAAPDFELGDCAGERHTLSGFRGRRVLLSFFRYAACPVCRYNVNKMNKQADLLKKAGIVNICIFPNSSETMVKYSMSKMSFLALSDDDGLVYNSFQVKKMTLRTMIANTITARKNKSKYKKYNDLRAILREMREHRGRWISQQLQLPADFLIDEDGTIVDLFRAKIFPDHMSIDRIEAFIPEDKRCKCSSKECLFPSCRQRYEETKNEPELIPTSVDEGFAEPVDFM